MAINNLFILIYPSNNRNNRKRHNNQFSGKYQRTEKSIIDLIVFVKKKVLNTTK